MKKLNNLTDDKSLIELGDHLLVLPFLPDFKHESAIKTSQYEIEVYRAFMVSCKSYYAKARGGFYGDNVCISTIHEMMLLDDAGAVAEALSVAKGLSRRYYNKREAIDKNSE